MRCCRGGQIPDLASLLSLVPDVLLPHKLALVSPAQRSEAKQTASLPPAELRALPALALMFRRARHVLLASSSSNRKVDRPAVKQPCVAN